MITFTQEEVEDLIDSVSRDVKRKVKDPLSLVDSVRHTLLRGLYTMVDEQVAQFEKERSQGPSSEEINPETTLSPAPPHSTEPEVD